LEGEYQVWTTSAPRIFEVELLKSLVAVQGFEPWANAIAFIDYSRWENSFLTEGLE